jgi:hypothetical protein
VAGDISHIMRACVSEYPARCRGDCHSVDYRPVLSISSSSGFNLWMVLLRCEIVFFSAG